MFVRVWNTKKFRWALSALISNLTFYFEYNLKFLIGNSNHLNNLWIVDLLSRLASFFYQIGTRNQKLLLYLPTENFQFSRELDNIPLSDSSLHWDGPFKETRFPVIDCNFCSSAWCSNILITHSEEIYACFQVRNLLTAS